MASGYDQWGIYRDLPDVVDADLVNNPDYTIDEKTAVQQARNRLRATGLVGETSLGIFSKNYGDTPAEHAAFQSITAPWNVVADAVSNAPRNVGESIGNTVSAGFTGLANGLGFSGANAGGVWDGLNKTMIVLSILVAVITLHSLMRKK